MANLNRYQLIGRLGKDPILAYSQNGYANTMLSIAVDSSRKNAQGKWEKVTQWFYITVWRSQAEYICNYGQKGSSVFIEGRLSAEWKKDANQKDVWELGLKVSKIEITGDGRKVNQQTQPSPQNQPPNQHRQPQQNHPPQDYQTQYDYQNPPPDQRFDEPPF